MTNIIEVESKIITLRDQQVILDSDVAELYGVQTKEINQAVRNNPEKFPIGYIWELSTEETQSLRSKILTLKNLGRGQHSKYPPKAFTEKGLYMLATILKSPQAVETTIAIVEAYAKLKELSRVIIQVPQQEENSVEQKTLLQRGGIGTQAGGKPIKPLRDLRRLIPTTCNEKIFSASVTFYYFCVIIMNKAKKWRMRHFGNGCMRPTSAG